MPIPPYKRHCDAFLANGHFSSEAKGGITVILADCNFDSMITVDLCQKIINVNSSCRFTNEQVKQIREFLYLLAKLQVEARIDK